MTVSASPNSSQDPDADTFRRRVLMGAPDLDEPEIELRVLFASIDRFHATKRNGHLRIICAATSGDPIPGPLARELKRIAEEEVIPALGDDDRKNFERTLRARQRPRPDKRPPTYPVQARTPRDVRRALGL